MCMTTTRLNEIRIPIRGLAGSRCANRVKEALDTVIGVWTTIINSARGYATIIYDPARAGLASLSHTIRQAGCGQARPQRAVLRLHSKKSEFRRTLPAPFVDEGNAKTNAYLDTRDSEILQHLIASAVERVAEAPAPPGASCPERHASTEATEGTT